jgi:hypothetical protein
VVKIWFFLGGILVGWSYTYLRMKEKLDEATNKKCNKGKCNCGNS